MALMGEQPEFVARLAADGAACIRGAFDAGWVELARAGIERNIAEPSPFFRNLGENGGGFMSDMWSRRYIPEFERFCTESPVAALAAHALRSHRRSEEHTSELQSLMRISYDVFCLKKKIDKYTYALT